MLNWRTKLDLKPLLSVKPKQKSPLNIANSLVGAGDGWYAQGNTHLEISAQAC